MKLGNWVALDKKLSKYFPIDREYSKIEAAFSLAIDYDKDKMITIAGYSKLWGWSRTKVRNFLEEMGVEILYQDDTLKIQKQKGQIKIQIEDRTETEKRQIRMVDTKCLCKIEDRKNTDKGQKKDRSEDTTINPIINPKPNKEYSEEIKLIIDYLNKRLGTNYTYANKKTKTCIVARINEGYRGESFKKVIDNKITDWLNTEQEKYLRPSTLFGSKFEEYLNQNTKHVNDSGKSQAEKEIEETRRLLNG